MMKIGQIRGKMLESICRLLLEDAGYTLIPKEKGKVIYKGSSTIIEIYGRGTKHQIDLPYEFRYHIPFVNPIQVIGEVKYFENPIEKDTMRQFIGVISDISSNYVVSHLPSISKLKKRRITQALFISATGFHCETEKLAYAHNIKLITFKGSPVFQPILDFIDEKSKIEVERGYKTVCYASNVRREIRKKFISNIKSYFLATTSTGHLMYFVSTSSFEFNRNKLNLEGRIIYEYLNDRIDPNIILTIDNTKFISTLPNKIFQEFQSEHKLRGNAINTKTHHFSPLTVYKKNSDNDIIVYKVHFTM